MPSNGHWGEGQCRRPAGGSVDGAQIVLGTALENTSWRHKVWAWRPGRPLLASFLDGLRCGPPLPRPCSRNRAVASELLARRYLHLTGGDAPLHVNDRIMRVLARDLVIRQFAAGETHI